MDSISNGLDTATAYDIIKAVKVLNQNLGTTNLISLLQVIRYFIMRFALHLLSYCSLLLMSTASSMRLFSSVKVTSSIKAIERVLYLTSPPWATFVLIRWMKQTSYRSYRQLKGEDS